ncbi:hypothetical protein BC834DRAFT_828471, partial [Gloeopeniophorella convolvens]
EVLWKLEDCKTDPLVDMKPPNETRPSMIVALRCANGTVCPGAVYNRIRRTADLCARQLFDLPTNPLGAHLPKGRSYFQRFHALDYEAAIVHLENSHKILRLCAGHWKADHMLGLALGSERKKESKRAATAPLAARLDSIPEFPELVPAVNAPSHQQTSTIPNPPTTPVKKSAPRASDKPQAGKRTREPNPAAASPSVARSSKRGRNDATSINKLTAKAPGPPSEQVTALLERVQHADPESPEINEDNMGESWGHDQFAGGGLTILSSLTSWQGIGDVTTAFKLIAAAIKTCKEARLMCQAMGKSVPAASFISDSYLEILLEHVRDCWLDAGGVSTSPPESSWT